MGRCRTCKYWYKGEKIHYSDTSVEWDGKPLLKAGMIEVKRSWDKAPMAWKSGQCMDPEKLVWHMVAVSKDEILTRDSFGCDNWVHDQGKDKFSHTYVDMRGQQSLEDYKNEMKLQPEYEEPIGVKQEKDNKLVLYKDVGWVLYPEPLGIELEPKLQAKE